MGSDFGDQENPKNPKCKVSKKNSRVNHQPPMSHLGFGNYLNPQLQNGWQNPTSFLL